ncbi:MAG: hypothetical protein ABJ364_08140 [Lentilitoribacter sp.]
MTNQFKSKQLLATDAYIADAKALPAFDPRVEGHLDWDALVWNIYNFVKRSNNSMHETMAFHHGGRTAKASTSRDSMRQPFGDLVKAFFAYRIDANGKKPATHRKTNRYKHQVRHLRTLEATLWDISQSVQPENIDGAALSAAVDKSAKSKRSEAAYVLRMVAKEWADVGICRNTESWTHPAINRPSRRSRINPTRERSCLSEDEVSCIGEAFHQTVNLRNAATTAADRVGISIVALLMCQPGRKGEVFILPADAEVVQRPGEGLFEGIVPFNEDERYNAGLRYFPLKGGSPMIKFVPKEMWPIAKVALKTIRDETQHARQVAKWLMEHPGQIRLPPQLDHVRRSNTITRKELCVLLNRDSASVNWWLSSRQISPIGKRGQVSLYAFEDIEKVNLLELPVGWPVLSNTSGVNYADALCICMKGQFAETHKTSEQVVEAIDQKIIDRVLKGRSENLPSHLHYLPSLFERLDVCLVNGGFPKITSHRLRHYLNTVAQRANVPQAHIAYWSGRKNVMQNENYDHSDMLFEVEQIKQKGMMAITDPKIPIFDDTNPNYLKAARKLYLHSTTFGYCKRRFLEEPCDRAGACRSCTNLICLGGSERTATAFLKHADRDEISLQNLRARQKNGQRTNQTIVDAVEHSMERSRVLADAINDPLNKGALIHNSDVGPLVDFSHPRRMIEERRKRHISNIKKSTIS